MTSGCHTTRRVHQRVALAALLVATAAAAPAADLYRSGTGTWDTTSTTWGTATGGPYDAATWSNATPDAAIFQGTAGTVTLGEAITAAGLTFETTGYTLTGSTLTLSGTPTIATGTGSATIASTLAGTSGFTKTGSATLTLSAANSISGAATVSAGRIVLGTDTALGTMAVTLDGGSIERNVAGATVANAIAVGAAGGTIVGRTLAIDNYMTLSGQLTGSGALTVQGLVTLSNTGNTYSGALTISNASASYLRLAASEVLGDTTVVTFGGAGAELRLDGGVTETIAGLNGTAGNIFVADGSGGGGRLRVSSGSYGGTLVNGNRSLILEQSGSGTLTLNRGGGNGQGIGGVEVSGGTLQLNAGGVSFKAGYFTGSQPITIRSGATLAVNQAWNIGASNVLVVDGGTLAFTTATDGPNYANILTVQNGGSVTGDWRLGDQATASLTTSGNATNSIAGSFRLTKQASGDTAWTVNVADGTAATDLDITAVISDLSGRAGATVVKTGAGTMRLAAANSYTGATTIAAGGVTLASGTALGSSPVTLTSATTGTSPVSLLLESAATVANAITAATNGTGTVTLGSTDSTTGVNREFSGVVTLARDLTLQAGSSDRTTFSNRITGTGSLTITSPFAADRRVVFDRPSGAANDFVGDVTLGAGGRLQLGVANAIGNRTLPDTATISFTDSNSSLRLAPTGSGDSETVGTLVSLAAGAGRVEMFTGTAFTLKIGGDGESGTFSGTILNSSGALTIEKVGSGTQTLSGSNTYSGGTFINAGLVKAGSSRAFGAENAAASTITIASGATLDINRVTGNTGDFFYGMTIAGSGTAGQGALINTGANGGTGLRQTPNITLSANGTIGGSGNILMINTGFAANALNLAGNTLTKTGTNTLFMANTTVSSGTIDIQQGTLSHFNTAANASAAAITLADAASASLALDNLGLQVGSLAGGGATGGNVTLGSATLTLGGRNENTSFAGAISGTGAVVKTGTGTQTFAAASTYSGGTTISAGTLVAGNANAFGTTGAISVGASGTLGVGDGVTFTRSFSLTAGGRVRTGNNATVSLPSVAALAAWESQSAAGDQTVAEILNASGSSTPTALFSAWTANPDSSRYLSDILTLEGTGVGNTYVLSMDYAAAFDNLNIWYRTNVGDPFTPLGTSFAGNVPWDGSFTTVGQYGVDTSAGTVWVVSDHNSQFVIVPEPGALGLASLGLAGAVWYLRRQRAAGRP